MKRGFKRGGEGTGIGGGLNERTENIEVLKQGMVGLCVYSQSSNKEITPGGDGGEKSLAELNNLTEGGGGGGGGRIKKCYTFGAAEWGGGGKRKEAGEGKTND